MIVSHAPPVGVLAAAIAIAVFFTGFVILHFRAMRRVRAMLFEIAGSFGWRELKSPFFSTGETIEGTTGGGRRAKIAYVLEGKSGPRTLVMHASWKGTSKFLLRRRGLRIVQIFSNAFRALPPRINSPVPIPSDIDLRGDDVMLVERLLGNGDFRQQLFEAIPRWLDEIRIGRGWVKVRREIPRVADPSRGAIQLVIAPTDEQLRTVATEEWAIVRALLEVDAAGGDANPLDIHTTQQS